MLFAHSFYSLPTETLAQNLLGAFLVHQSAEGITGGRIVETEAYLSLNDPACHAHRGVTKRNLVMFGPPGRAYIYLIYGMYYCLNVVSGEDGKGEAVLIRALEPLIGIDLMQHRRNERNIIKLCSGPGKLAMAMGIDQSFNGACFRKSNLKLHRPDSFSKKLKTDHSFEIKRTSRVGISTGKDLLLRFYIENNHFVSKVKLCK